MPAKKKQSKKPSKNLLRKINFGSRKTQALTTVLVFAVIGGGLLIYKSFAATASWTYNYANGQAATQVSATKQGSVSVITDPGKNNTKVYLLSASGAFGANANVHTINAGITATTPPAVIGYNYRACAWVAEGRLNDPSIYRIDFFGNGFATHDSFTTSATNSAYAYSCTPEVYVTNPGAVTASVQVAQPGNPSIRVSTIVIERTTNVVSWEPAPAPAK